MVFHQFVDFVLPHVNDAIVDAIFCDLKCNGTVVGNQWKAFPQNLIATNYLEDMVFGPLQVIWEAVVMASTLFISLVDLKHQGHNSSVLECYNTSLLDRVLVLKNTMHVSIVLKPLYKDGKPRNSWEDLAVMAEYKRGKRLEDFFDMSIIVLHDYHEVIHGRAVPRPYIIACTLSTMTLAAILDLASVS